MTIFNLESQYAFVTPSTGTTTVVAAQAGFRILVCQLCVITASGNTVYFQSNGSTTISASFPLAANGGFVLPFSELGWFQTNIGESLTITTTSGPTAVQLVWAPSLN